MSGSTESTSEHAPTRRRDDRAAGQKPAEHNAAGEKAGGEKAGYRHTLNLPTTAFPMKANLIQNEPASLKRWETMDLYGRVRAAGPSRPRGRFVFHDGPPYANAHIHLGHLMNKCLKDFVVRSRGVMGFDCPYVPGWDCHGLPIEHKVMMDLVESGKAAKLAELPDDARRLAVRRACRAYAEKHVKIQAKEMQRLLTLADYAHPYLTMAPEYEAGVLEVLAGLLERGLVYRALKPVHWSPANETALADAELEYEDREDPSVYVDFEAEDAAAVHAAFGLGQTGSPTVREGLDRAAAPEDVEGSDDEDDAASPPGQRPCFMIWTTTPWTLPANLAIAVHPRVEYALVLVDGNVTVIAAALVEKVTRAAGAEDVKVLARTMGDRLVGLRYRHPFLETRTGETGVPPGEAPGPPRMKPSAGGSPVFRIVPAEYVTLDDGTGLVHTAPGHGAEDFMTGQREGLPVYCPVREDGSYDDTVPPWLRGLNIFKANDLIVQHLIASGHMFHSHTITHSYPHDWRGKTPVIFRCTEQWFIGVDLQVAGQAAGSTLRTMALDAVAAGPQATVTFVPEWGRNRMRGMLDSRPDWCISRQRSWGLPIPAFFWRDTHGAERVLMTPAVVRAVAGVMRQKGSDAWYQLSARELLAGYDLAGDGHEDAAALREAHADGSRALAALTKGGDILDVWFESGSSWNAVMRQRSNDADYPCDLYLEGSDQHRGWFQSSLLPALGVTGAPPYRTLLTHGFMVDKDGRKMSKSVGNTLNVEDLMRDFGADVMRWWVCSLSYENDVKVDRRFFELAGESYRKVRNTLRFMLSNLDDVPAEMRRELGEDVAAPGRGHGTPTMHGTPPLPAPESLDAWVLGEYNALAAEVLEAYGRYEYRTVHSRLYDFCNDTLSSMYLAAIKDRMYCDAPDSPRRRQTQATLWRLTDALCRLLSPVLCHTADEAYRSLLAAGDAQTSVHTLTAIERFDIAPDAAWTTALAMRELAMKAIEEAKAPPAEGGLGVENPLDLGLEVDDPSGMLSRLSAVDLADVCGVSRVMLRAGRGELAVRCVDLRGEPRCERSWKRDGTVKRRSDGGMLGDRDAAVLGLA